MCCAYEKYMRRVVFVDCQVVWFVVGPLRTNNYNGSNTGTDTVILRDTVECI